MFCPWVWMKMNSCHYQNVMLSLSKHLDRNSKSINRYGIASEMLRLRSA